MQPRQIARIRSTWSQVIPHADVVPALFFEKLFDLDPTLRRYFQGDLDRFGRRMMTALDVMIARVHDPRALGPLLGLLAARYAATGIGREHCETVSRAFIWTLRVGLGRQLDHEARAAWRALLAMIGDSMQAEIDRAAQQAA